MRIVAIIVVLAAMSIPHAALAQQNAREQLRIYRQQADPGNRFGADWHDYARYDHDRLESGQSRYYADRYYRDGRYYAPRVLTRDDRLYRGSGTRYYCRRADGTTGLVEGVAGRLRSDTLPRGGSAPLATIVLQGGEGVARAVDRGQLVCR